MRQLAYQDKVLKALDAYIEALKTQKAEADAIAKLAETNERLKGLIPDFTKDAWEDLRKSGRLPNSRAAIAHSERKDGIKRPVPNAVLKVPTGGGKT